MAAAVATAPRSPAASPRLPSPPPFPEVQLPPNSPSMHPSDATPSPPPPPHTLRRIRPGTKAADMSAGPPLVPLNELDSAFQHQEHLKALHSHHTHPTPTTTCPLTATSAREIAAPPQGVDKSLWLYELTRFLVARANDLLVSFFAESPPCSVATCPEMRASEWQYLCAVHEPPKPCCAIDYSCHTLDWAAYTLTSSKFYPSRLTLSEGSKGTKELGNIMRRVYRIFAHAWFSHRATFWEVEGREGLYVLFKTVCEVYGLMAEENYTVPKEAEEGSKSDGNGAEEVKGLASPTKKSGFGSPEKKAATQESTATALRRHKATPSVGSAVTTIHEGDEEDTKDGAGEGLKGGLLDKIAKGTAVASPLPIISKTVEKIEVPPLKQEEEDDQKADDKAGVTSAGSAHEVKTDSTEGDSSDDTTGLRRTNSSDSVATIVKVEEKEVDDD